MQGERADIYQRITDSIVKAIEGGADRWQMPWHHDGRDAFSPMNARSKRPYRGVNVLSLWAAAQEKSYDSGLWATYQQWQELGAQVRKGEHAISVVFWKFPNSRAEESGDDEEETTKRRGVIARGYFVFNVAQVDGYELPDVPKLPEVERIERAERFFLSLGADIRHGGRRAYYSKVTDHIQMPPFEVFREAIPYYGTLAHEMTHWTGAERRLNRDLSGRFGNESYAAEELVAELGAAFLCADLGLANEPRTDHAAYVQSWLKVLKNDKRAIFTAAAKAQAAADWLHAQVEP